MELFAYFQLISGEIARFIDYGGNWSKLIVKGGTMQFFQLMIFHAIQIVEKAAGLC